MIVTPSPFQLLEDPEQVIRLRVAERRRRLVEREDAALERERARHLQQLAMGDAQRFDRRVGGDRRAEAREQIARRASRISALRSRPKRPVGSRPTKMFAAADRFGNASVSW